MAESLLIDLGKSKRSAASLVASSGGRELHSPVVRFVMGLPASDMGSPSPSQPQARPSSRPPSAPEAQSTTEAQSKESVQDKLFKRLLFADTVGYGVPGPGVLTGAAFRSALRGMGEERGGLVGMDVTNLTPEEERALPILLDPEWVERQRRNQQL